MPPPASSGRSSRPDGSLLVYDYTGEGFNPSIIQPEVRKDLASIRFLGTEVVNAHPELKQWGVGSPAKIPLDELITNRGTYDPFKRMRFDAHYPIVQGYDQKAAFGYYIHVADPLQFRQFSADISVSPYRGPRRRTPAPRRRISNPQLEADLLAQSR